jgi:uroporphyrinogen-III synthase
MRIWISRAQPEAEATALRVRALGHEPLVAPVLQVQPIGDAPNLQGVGALAFTSRNGARAFAALTRMRDLQVFAVGDSTAEVAREAGFAKVSSASGDVAALAALIGASRASFKGEVLYAAPEEPAGDLIAALAECGAPARAQAVYRTTPTDFTPPPGAQAVLVHSAKAARRLAEAQGLDFIEPVMAAICISAAAAEPLQGLPFGEVLVAPAPTEAALLETLEAWAARQTPPKLFTPLFWIVIGFGLVCIAAAILVASLGPQLFPATPR